MDRLTLGTGNLGWEVGRVGWSSSPASPTYTGIAHVERRRESDGGEQGFYFGKAMQKKSQQKVAVKRGN